MCPYLIYRRIDFSWHLLTRAFAVSVIIQHTNDKRKYAPGTFYLIKTYHHLTFQQQRVTSVTNTPHTVQKHDTTAKSAYSVAADY